MPENKKASGRFKKRRKNTSFSPVQPTAAAKLNFIVALNLNTLVIPPS